MVLVAALCLGIGFGLGRLWHSSKEQRGGGNTGGETAAGVNTEGQAPAAPAKVSTAAAAPPDPAMVAEVKRQIPNFASLSLEEGSRMLRAAALKDLQAALSQMQGQIKEAEQRVTRAEEAKSGTEKQAALQVLQRLQAEQAARLGEFTTRSSAQIEALKQIKELAR
jgi:hypothetical protein